MIKYINSKACLFKFNEDTEDIKPVDEIDLYIGYVNCFILDEDGEINGEEVHSGDVVMTILNGEAMFKVPDNVANIIKDKVAKRNENIKEKASLSDCCNKAKSN